MDIIELGRRREFTLGDDLIQRRNDLVADDELRFGRKRSSNAYPVLLSARLCGQPVGKPIRLELDEIEQIPDTAFERLAFQPEIHLRRSVHKFLNPELGSKAVSAVR
ncbi:hypothetical protein J2S28_005606 [Rhizobium sp. SLBN-94]|nr:hypothetical protein [Rhizobium sp. SLBN-94]